MHPNRIWKGFLFIVTASSLFYGLWTAHLYFEYRRYNRSTILLTIEWSVQERGENDYRVQGSYTFKTNEKLFQAQDTLREPVFLNTWAAHDFIKTLNEHPPRVWFSGDSPDHSTLQKKFPLKECISTVVLAGIVIYLFGLGYYVKLRKG